MKSIEIIVPRSLIKKFYPHPEDRGHGEYVVDLINGMYTDVFYREAGDFVTITNDEALIFYLKNNSKNPREYFYRNGVFSFRNIFDYDLELLNDWMNTSPKKLKIKLSKKNTLPSQFLICFYWIEVGKVIIKSDELLFLIYEEELIANIDIELLVELVKEI